MTKFILRIAILLIIILTGLIAYLSYFGLETDKFDDLIKKKANEVNQHVQLEFKKTKIHLNATELNLVIKLQNPNILIKNSQIDLSKIDLFLSLKSFLSSDFLLKRAEISFAKNDIKDLTKVTNIFVPTIINKQLNKIFVKGKLEGEFKIPFNSDGSIGKDYGFSGKILGASINLTKEFIIKNLTTEINNEKDSDGNAFNVIIKKGTLYELELADSTINLKRKNGETIITSLLRTNGKLNFSEIKKILYLFNLKIGNLKDVNCIADLKTSINFKLNNKLRVKNLNYSTTGDISYLEFLTDEKKIIKKFLPEYDPKIILKNTQVKLLNSKSNNSIELDGLIKANDNNFDKIKLNQIYDYNKKTFNISGIVDLTNSKVKIQNLNYYKDLEKKSKLSFDVNFLTNNYYNVKKLNYLEGKSKINITNLKLNKKFEVSDFGKIKINTFNNQKENNNFLIEKLKKITISGNVFDAQPLLKSLYKKTDKKTFTKDFSSDIKVNFKKAITGTNDDVINFAMIASIKDGSYNKLSLKGNFSENEIIEMSIYEVNKDKKTLQVISDRARTFIKNFDFIKGFEGGKLEYESVISKKISNSNLTITDFKVSKVPALAKLLTLASLQGIADTLGGDGIRFESFEMKTNTEGNVMNIEDALAMGPAISILLEGYVDKGRVVSLRGTLVPATKLNSIIASIPLVGDILVGKKTGEGIVGVSFKMKGPPKDIKTTVNPIKTLTPRFIVRAVEKMKKKKREDETK